MALRYSININGWGLDPKGQYQTPRAAEEAYLKLRAMHGLRKPNECQCMKKQ